MTVLKSYGLSIVVNVTELLKAGRGITAGHGDIIMHNILVGTSSQLVLMSNPFLSTTYGPSPKLHTYVCKYRFLGIHLPVLDADAQFPTAWHKGNPMSLMSAHKKTEGIKI